MLDPNYSSPASPSGPLTRCPDHDDMWWINRRTGEKRPDRCRRNTCVWCVHIEATKVAAVLTMAQPTMALTVTLVPPGWPAPGKAMARLARIVRRHHGPASWKVAYTIEGNPRATGYHAHLLHRGSHIRELALNEYCQSAGLGLAKASVIHPTAPLTYSVKSFRTLHEHRDQDAAQHLLDSALHANNGRLIHNTRGFIIDRNGNPISLRQAKSLITHHRYNSDWYRVCCR